MARQGTEIKKSNSREKPDEAERFTDRVESRKALKKILNQYVYDYENKINNPYHLSFIGDGGVGKTALLKELIREVYRWNPDYDDVFAPVYYDLEKGTNIVHILASLRGQIFMHEPGAQFPNFDSALKRYIELENDIELANIKTHTTKEDYSVKAPREIELLMNMFTDIPGIKEINTVYRQIGNISELISLFLKKDDELREKFKEKSSGFIRDNIAKYFLDDLKVELRNKCIVFFIDTFEVLSTGAIGYSQRKGNSTEEVKLSCWFKEELALFGHDTISVFAGREPIFNDVNEYELKGLIQDDCESYLKQIAKLQTETKSGKKTADIVYQISDGIPLYLELCGDIIRDEKWKDEEYLSIDRNELVQRYIKYLDNRDQTLMLEVMAALLQWKEDDFKEIFCKTYKCDFLKLSADYNKVKDLSMIKTDKKSSYLHRSVQDAIYTYKEFSPEEKTAVMNAILQVYSARIKEEHSDVYYYLERIIDFYRNRAKYKETLSHEQIKDLYYLTNDILDKAIKHHLPMSESLLNAIIAYRDCGIQPFDPYSDGLLSDLIGRLKFENDDLEGAKKAIDDSYDILAPILQETDPLLLKVLYHRIRILEEERENEEAVPLLELLIDRRLKNPDLDIKETMELFVEYSIQCMQAYQDQKAVSAAERLYEMSKQKFGEEDFFTCAILPFLSKTYWAAGEDQKSEVIKNNLLQKGTLLLDQKDETGLDYLWLLVDCYHEERNYKEELNITKQILKYERDIYGLVSEQVIRTMNYLSYLYSKIGDKDISLKLQEKCYELKKEKDGETDPNTLVLLRNLAITYSNNKEYKKADQCFEKYLEILTQVYGETSYESIKALYDIAEHFTVRKDHQNALWYAKKNFLSLAENRKSLLSSDENNQKTEAEDLLERCENDDLNTKPDSVDTDLPDWLIADSDIRETIKWLAKKYSNAGMHDASINLYKTVLKYEEKMYGFSNQKAIRLRRNLSAECLSAGRIEEAIKLLGDNYELVLNDSRKNKEDVVDVFLDYVRILDDHEKKTELNFLYKSYWIYLENKSGVASDETISAFKDYIRSFDLDHESKDALAECSREEEKTAPYFEELFNRTPRRAFFMFDLYNEIFLKTKDKAGFERYFSDKMNEFRGKYGETDQKTLFLKERYYSALINKFDGNEDDLKQLLDTFDQMKMLYPDSRNLFDLAIDLQNYYHRNHRFEEEVLLWISEYERNCESFGFNDPRTQRVLGMIQEINFDSISKDTYNHIYDILYRDFAAQYGKNSEKFQKEICFLTRSS